MHICLQESMCTFEKQLNICISDESYHDWYFPRIWSCFSGVHTFSHSSICLQKAWKILKFDIFFKKVNFKPFCCNGNAMKLKKYYVFLHVSYASLHIKKNKFKTWILKFCQILGQKLPLMPLLLTRLSWTNIRNCFLQM